MKACNQVRSGTWWMVLVSLAVALGAGTVQGVVILQDDFSGPAGPVDSTKWDTLTTGSGSVALTGAGTVQLTHPTGSTAGLSGKSAFTFAATSDIDRGRLTVAPTSHSGNSLLGLNNVPDTDWILLRNDGGDGVHWRVEMATNSVTSQRVLSVPRTNVGTWVIDWFPGHVDISFNGSPVFNSDSDAPDAGGWTIPTVAMKPFLFGYTGNSDVYDSVLWEIVPEPSVVMLGTATGLLFWRRRNRR